MRELRSFGYKACLAVIALYTAILLFMGAAALLFPGEARPEERPVQPTVVFSFPEEHRADVDHFELHWIPVPGSGIIEYICTLDDPTRREWETPAFEMGTGDIRPFYLVAVMTDGRKGWSDYFDFRFTGKPFIVRIEKGEVL